LKISTWRNRPYVEKGGAHRLRASCLGMGKKILYGIKLKRGKVMNLGRNSPPQSGIPLDKGGQIH